MQEARAEYLARLRELGLLELARQRSSNPSKEVLKLRT
jgi:hypothetical protein